MSLLKVLTPITFVLRPIRVVKGAFTVAETILPITHIPIPQKFIGGRWVEPDMCTETRLHIVDPVASVLLIWGDPVHCAVSIPLIMLPIAFVEVSAGVGHFTLAPLHSFQPVALVDWAVFIAKLAVTVTHSVDPLAFIYNSFFFIVVETLAVAETIHDLSFVVGAIRPLISAFTCDFVLAELAFIYSPVRPFESASSME